MHLTLIACGALCAALATPGFAQVAPPPSTTYFVAQDVKTKKCFVVDHRPMDVTKAALVEVFTFYPTRAQAEMAMKTMKACGAL